MREAGGRHHKEDIDKYEVVRVKSSVKWGCGADRRTEIKGGDSCLVDWHSSRRMGCNYIKMYVSLQEEALGHR